MSAYRFSGYWKDVGTVRSLWDANMDLLCDGCGIDLYDEDWPIYARTPIRPPHISGPRAEISRSLVTNGCEVCGVLTDCVVFHSVTVEAGARVQGCVLMPGAVVKAGAAVERTIVAEHAVIEENAVVGGGDEIAVVAAGVQVGRGATVSPGAMVTQPVKAGERI